jgi:hypothetical protein
VFGTALPDTPRDVYLWQLIGAGVSTLVGPIALTQRVRSAPVCFVITLCSLLFVQLIRSTGNCPCTVTLLRSWHVSRTPR